MQDLIISKYVLFFEQNGTCLLFNSKDNSFLELKKDLYEELVTIQEEGESSLFDDDEFVNKLVELGILTTRLDDQAFLDDIILKNKLCKTTFYCSLTQFTLHSLNDNYFLEISNTEPFVIVNGASIVTLLLYVNFKYELFITLKFFALIIHPTTFLLDVTV